MTAPSSERAPLAELDLAIPDMDSPRCEMEVKALLEKLPGLEAVRLLERGAWLRYRPATISHEQIVAILRQAGFRASIFQDSKSGKTGLSSQ